MPAPTELFLRAAVDVGGILQPSADPRAEIGRVLAVVGPLVGASRADWYEVEATGPVGEALMTMRAEWCAPGVRPNLDAPEAYRVPIARIAPLQHALLSAGQPVAGLVADFGEAARQRGERLGQVARLAVPLIVGGRLAGHLGLDQAEARAWQPAEIDLLRLVAAQFVAALERHTAKGALEDRTWQLLHLVDALPTAVVLKDARGRWMMANRSALRIFGLSGHDYRGRTNQELLAETGQQREVFEACLRTDPLAVGEGRAVRYEESIPGPDGGAQLLEVTKIPVYRADGQLQGLVCVKHEITEQRRLEGELLRRERQLRELAETVEACLWSGSVELLDGLPSLVPESVSAGIEALTGRRAEEFIGHPEVWRAAVHPDDLKGIQRFFAQLVPGATRRYRLRIVRRDGTPRWVLATVSATFDEGGVLRRLDGVTQDIQALREAEEEHERALHGQWEEEHRRALGRFALGIAELLTGDAESIWADPETLAHGLRDLAGAARPAAATPGIAAPGSAVAADAAPIAAAPRPVAPAVALEAVVFDALEAARPGFGPGLRLATRLDRTLPAIPGDAAALARMLGHLLDNALEALGGRPGELAVQTAAVALAEDELSRLTFSAARAGRFAVVEVADSGPGISAAEQARLFEPFGGARGPGRGLGLAAVRGIVEAHRGALLVRATPGRGTAVYIYLPLE